VVVTHDQDFLAEGAKRQRGGIEFSGIIYGRQQRLSGGEWIDVLKTIAYCCEPDELRNQVCFVTSP
jgi:hypothetical protein